MNKINSHKDSLLENINKMCSTSDRWELCKLSERAHKQIAEIYAINFQRLYDEEHEDEKLS